MRFHSAGLDEDPDISRLRALVNRFRIDAEGVSRDGDAKLAAAFLKSIAPHVDLLEEIDAFANRGKRSRLPSSTRTDALTVQ